MHSQIASVGKRGRKRFTSHCERAVISTGLIEKREEGEINRTGSSTDKVKVGQPWLQRLK